MWAITKRIFLFFAVNIFILLTLSLAFNLIVSATGVQLSVDQNILLWYAMLGFGGALISLAMSRQLAKWTLGVRVIDPRTTNGFERKLVETVHNLARTAGLRTMPEVGIYESPDVNAFATGPTNARALVAVSTGLMERMDDQALQGVIGHELAHVANGDMVTMTLLQGVINTMVLVLARIISGLIAGQMDQRSRPYVRMGLYYGLQILLSLLGSVVVCYFSRRREFRADAGGARLAGRERMLAGLRSLRLVYGQVDTAQQSVASLKISGPSRHSLAALFSTHPPLEERIRRLETMAI